MAHADPFRSNNCKNSILPDPPWLLPFSAHGGWLLDSLLCGTIVSLIAVVLMVGMANRDSVRLVCNRFRNSQYRDDASSDTEPCV